MKARPRRYDPVKTGWLASCIVALGTFGLLVRNIQAVWASPAMAVPQRDTSRLVSDYQAVNSQVEQTPKVMTDLLRGLDCKVWVKVPSVPVRSVDVHRPCDADDSPPSVDDIRAAQRKAVADLGDHLRSFPTTFGQVTLADDDLFRVRVGNRDVLWIPSGDKAFLVLSLIHI